MPPDSPVPASIALDDSSLYIHRELSQLQFNIRVLEQALDETTPLLERLRFLLIFSSNMDEFFEIRVAGLKRQISRARPRIDADGIQPHQALERIAEITHQQVERQYRILNRMLLPALAEEGIAFIRRRNWTPAIREWVAGFFHTEVAPVMTPSAWIPPTRFHCWPTRASTSSSNWKVWMTLAAIWAWPSCRLRAACPA